MHFTVSQRIIGSYAILMAFTAFLLATGIYGITQINGGLHNLTEHAIPLTKNVTQMSTSLLQAEIYLMEHQRLTKASELAEVEKSLADEYAHIREGQSNLLVLVKENQDLAAPLEVLQKQTADFFRLNHALVEHRNQVVALMATSARLNRETIDALDNTINKAIDIQVLLAGGQRAQVAGFISDLEKMGAAIKKSMDSSIPAAVVGVRSQAKSKLELTDKVSSDIAGYSGEAKSKPLQQYYDQFKKSAFGDDGLLNTQINMLRLQKQNSDEFSELSKTIHITTGALGELEHAVSEISAETSDKARITVTSSRSILIFAGCILLVLSMVIATSVIRSIIRPLTEMVGVVERVAEGDLTRVFNDQKDDEFGHFAKGLNMLVGNLRNIIRELDSNSQLLSATSAQTSVASRNTFNNINQQKIQTDMIAAAVEEMSLTVDEVAKSAANTLREVELAHATVTEGEHVIADNISSINDLAHDIELSAEVIEQLNRRSNDIGGVLDVIRSVAEQTNLLALNAAIEAARAGEQGRGFAVVADEVRALAGRAQQSTSEIHEMVAQLQSGANQAVETMNNCRKQAHLRVESISSAGKVLDSIAASVTKIKDMSYQIASASEEQSSTTREQNRNIVAIVDAAEKTADVAQENQRASESLAQMANEQLKMIRHFTI